MELQRQSIPLSTKAIDPAIRHVVEKLLMEPNSEAPSMFNLEDKVFHELFGVGEIVNVNGAGAHRKLRINFQLAGMKVILEQVAVKSGKLRMIAKPV